MQESFWDKVTYVMRVSRKPTREELVENFKVAIAGVLIMGLLGFVISVIFGILSKGL